jgi:hypothetical protein
MKTKLFLCLYLLTLSVSLPAQSGDYLEMVPRSEMLSCRAPDSAATQQFLNRLLGLQPDSINKNKAHYYTDLSLCYYDLYYRTSDSNYFDKAIHFSEAALKEDSAHKTAYSTLMVLHHVSGHCKTLSELVDAYQRHIPNEMQDRKQLKEHQRKIKKCK